MPVPPFTDEEKRQILSGETDEVAIRKKQLSPRSFALWLRHYEKGQSYLITARGHRIHPANGYYWVAQVDPATGERTTAYTAPPEARFNSVAAARAAIYRCTLRNLAPTVKTPLRRRVRKIPKRGPIATGNTTFALRCRPEVEDRLRRAAGGRRLTPGQLIEKLLQFIPLLDQPQKPTPWLE